MTLSSSAQDLRTLSAQARQYKAAGQLDQALTLYRRAAEADPGNAVAAHNLAALLGDMTRFSEARHWAEQAVRLNREAPESLLVLARAQQGQGDFAKAEESFEQALAARPSFIEAHHDLAQLRWMLSGDARQASTAIDREMARDPENAALPELKAHILRSADCLEEAATAIERAATLAPEAPKLRIVQSEIAARQGKADAQLAFASQALQLDRSSHTAAKAVLEALLHCGRAQEAEDLAIRILQAHPGDQGIVALLTTAWRMRGDPRHETFCTQLGLVSSGMIETPSGWDDLPSYLDDLKAALLRRHPWKSHPLDQSLRHGSQTQEDLTQSSDPAIHALFVAIRPVIERHIAALGAGKDPVRMRSNGRFRLCPAWSVALSPGGFHVDHVHPQGWMSSAFYVDLPPAVERGREGWLAFGRPGIPTRPALEPFHYIRPQPGMLAIFPSYLWHGTEVFSGDAKRLTVAFDILPGI
ncbi:tetratricopeptide repeat protein [Altererythrobacter endophyticus]|uniref:Tetratricopeptide repeat protein n=2 Tax=Altericroceibacterium endophyticum TaxID=1808508 RepID=A0A6I4T6E8_9SPHN|nr:putative 2OG-Fe(II) oxygenase [Altericroceibacterium endophyticum]MXO66407.1 tetratricopeptide repeat protein [Altericroceibacterium endophyticum]